MSTAAKTSSVMGARSKAGRAPSRQPVWLVIALSPGLLWLHVGTCAVLLVFFTLDVVMVHAGVSCSVYRATIQGFPGDVLGGASTMIGIGGIVLRLTGQVVARQGWPRIGASLGLFALEAMILGLALILSLGETLLYCM